MKEIALTKGRVAIVDDDDYEYLKDISWCWGSKYPITSVRIGRKTKTFHLHKMIMRADRGQIVDHINGNTLDNRKENLRFATASENQRNSRVPKNNTTGYKGVVKHMGKYQVQIRAGGEKIYIGRYANLFDACLAYNEACLKYHGEFAVLNQWKGEI